jgi:hypothetical protein
MTATFQAQFLQAIKAMLALATYREVFIRFFAAYEYRRQFPWLEEHQPRRKGEYGLASALQTALATYIVSEGTLPEASTTLTISAPDQGAYPTIDGIWVDEFMQAVTATIEEKVCLERFAQRLAR